MSEYLKQKINKWKNRNKQQIHLPENKETFSRKLDLFLLFTVTLLTVILILATMAGRSGSDTDTVYAKKELILPQNYMDLLGTETATKLLADYREKNPDIRIELSAAAGEKKNEPDLLFFYDYELSSLLYSETTGTKNKTMEPAVPLVSFMNMLFYNIKLLDAAGFNRPPKTRAEFLTWAKAIDAGGKASGSALGLNSSDREAVSRDIFSWIWAAGGSLWPQTESHQKQKPALNTKNTADIISFLGTLNSDNLLAYGTFIKTGMQRLDEFAQGKIAMIIASTRDIPQLREKMGDGAFGITSVPGAAQQGKNGVKLSHIYAGISASCENPDEARSFLTFLTEQSYVISEGFKAVPGAVSGSSSSYSLKDYIIRDPDFFKAWDIFEASEIITGLSGIPNAEEYENVFREELESYFLQKKNTQDTVAAIQNRWAAIPEY